MIVKLGQPDAGYSVTWIDIEKLSNLVIELYSLTQILLGLGAAGVKF
jgi:hypothetical protein